jgi:hypothetical protein
MRRILGVGLASLLSLIGCTAGHLASDPHPAPPSYSLVIASPDTVESPKVTKDVSFLAKEAAQVEHLVQRSLIEQRQQQDTRLQVLTPELARLTQTEIMRQERDRLLAFGSMDFGLLLTLPTTGLTQQLQWLKSRGQVGW